MHVSEQLVVWPRCRATATPLLQPPLQYYIPSGGGLVASVLPPPGSTVGVAGRASDSGAPKCDYTGAQRQG